MVDQVPSIPLNEDVRSSWETWLGVTKDRCHLHFKLEGGSLETHLAACLDSAMATALRVKGDIGAWPTKILELGCSTGFNCIALARLFPQAEVYGIEPDGEAVSVARSMAAAAQIDNAYFLQGVGEELPFRAEEFDLIICLTVIEHVNDVQRVIAELARVLAPCGLVRLEAPNYIWPHEPHLDIWCIPLLGKKFVRLMAVLQGKATHLGYLDHIKFVTPGLLESAFRKNGLSWDNLVKAKLEQLLAGDVGQIVAHKRIANLLRLAARIGLDKSLVGLVLQSKLYPSVLYRARKYLRD